MWQNGNTWGCFTSVAVLQHLDCGHVSKSATARSSTNGPSGCFRAPADSSSDVRHQSFHPTPFADRPIQGFRWSIADCRSPKTQALPAAAGGRSRARVSAASVADYDAMPVFDDARARSRRNFRSAANRETTKMIKLSHSKHWPHAPLLARKAGS